MNDGQNAVIFWLLTTVHGGGDLGVENRVCYFKCKFSRLVNSLEECSPEFAGSSFFSLHWLILLHGLCNKGFVPVAARTSLWSPVSRSGCNNTAKGFLVLAKNKWNQVDVNSHFTMTVVHSSCLRNT